jgi:hypothetical protein
VQERRQNCPLLSVHTGESGHRLLKAEFLLFDEGCLHRCAAIVRTIPAALVENSEALRAAFVPVEPCSSPGKNEDRVLSPFEAALPDSLFRFECVVQHPPASANRPCQISQPIHSLDHPTMWLSGKRSSSLAFFELLPTVLWLRHNRFDIDEHRQAPSGAPQKSIDFAQLVSQVHRPATKIVVSCSTAAHAQCTIHCALCPWLRTASLPR